MEKAQYPEELLARLMAVEKKRPRAVIDHILKHGHVTTEELRNQYGYNDPPRGARDVREEGIPLETFRVKDSQGRSIAAYRLGDLSAVRQDRIGGRVAFSKAFKRALLQQENERCSICCEHFEARELQVDHRVPYEVAGDALPKERDPNDYMLLCGSCNRAKSWSCEHCPNLRTEKRTSICHDCYWANPQSYRHVALRQLRRLDVTWSAEETREYDALSRLAARTGTRLPLYVKDILRKCMKRRDRE